MTAGIDSDHSKRDLFETIEKGGSYKWTMMVQVGAPRAAMKPVGVYANSYLYDRSCNPRKRPRFLSTRSTSQRSGQGVSITIRRFYSGSPPQENESEAADADPHHRIPADFPMQEVGELELNRNPEDYHRDVEQAAFSPGSLVPGIELSPDTLLNWRAFL
jgi:catalase